MKESQHAFPQIVYRFNHISDQLKADLFVDEDSRNDRSIVLTVYDFFSRNFHWLVVDDKKWEFEDLEVAEIREYISQNRTKKGNSHEGAFQDIVSSIIESSPINKSTILSIVDTLLSTKCKIEFHQSILHLYQSFPIRNDQYVDGVFLRNFQKEFVDRTSKLTIDSYIKATLLDLCPDGWPVVQMNYFFDGGNLFQESTHFSTQMAIVDKRNKNSFIPRNHRVKSKDKKNRFYYNYLLPLFNNEIEVQDFIHNASKNNKKSKKPKNKIIFFLPIFEYTYKNKPLGSFCGTIQIPCQKNSEFSELVEKSNDKIKPKMIDIVNELKQSSLHDALQARYNPNDSTFHQFLLGLFKIQNIDSLTVFRKSGRHTCYRRKNNVIEKCDNDFGCDSEETCIKENCSGHCRNNEVSPDNYCSYSKHRDHIIKQLIKEDFIFCDDCYSVAFKASTYFDKISVPDLYPEDIVEINNVYLLIRYSKYLLYAEESKIALWHYYLREQSDLFRQLALQRRVLHETRRHGTRAAVAAIMGRNMSHNIGSHVLSHHHKFLQSTGALKIGDTIRESIFIDYLRFRMDFIAHISTGDPFWYSSMHLINDLINPFLKQTILLTNINKSEGIVYEGCGEEGNKLVIDVYVDGEKLSFTPYDKRTGSTKTFRIDHDLKVAIPHYILGVHAFYTILENFIRNSAKHSKVEGDLVISINIDPTGKDFYLISLSDNIFKEPEDILKMQAACSIIKSPLIDSNGRLEYGGWGFKEQRISANYLRLGSVTTNEVDGNFPPEYLGERSSAAPILQVQDEVDNLYNGGELSFYLLKPKDILIAEETPTAEIKPFSDSKDIISKNVIYPPSRKVFPHRFLIIKNSEGCELPDTRYQTNLPIRTLFDVENKTCNDITLEYCYRLFVEHQLVDKYKVLVCLNGEVDNLENVSDREKKDLDNIIMLEDHGNSFCEYFGTEAIYLPYRSESPIGKYITSRMKNFNVIDYYKFIEAGLTNLLIADERIALLGDNPDTLIATNQKECFREKYDRTLLNKDVWKKMGVHLVDLVRESGNVTINFDGLNKAMNSIKNNFSTFILIHQGLIDKMQEEDSLELGAFVKDLPPNTFYFITSGRGALPPELLNNARYLEISGVEALMNESDKFTLLQILYSTRRKTNVFDNNQ